MSEHVLPGVPDEPSGDQADQASRLQMIEEQDAIRAALGGQVYGSDAYGDRSEVDEPLDGPDPFDAESADASDDPFYGGGMAVDDAGDTGDASDDPFYGGGMAVDDAGDTGLNEDDEWVGSDLAAGAAQDRAAMNVDEGGTITDDPDSSPFESDDPDFAAEPVSLDGEHAAEDIDALIDFLDLGHDLDDPQNPDGYGMPPARDGGTAVIDEARERNRAAER